MARPERLKIIHTDGYEAAARFWSAATAKTRTAVLYLHGIQSHGGWFETSAERLASAGCCVLMPDRRGSGLNQRDRGHVPSVGRLMRDIEEAISLLRDRADSDRLSIVGVSWGGKLALAFALLQPGLLDTVALVAPGLFPAIDLPTTTKVFIACCALAAQKRRFDIPLNEPHLFTENPERQRFIRDDPLRLTKATARFFAVSAALDRLIRRTAPKVRWPWRATFILAGRDRIIDNNLTKRFARSLRCRDVTIVEHMQASHTLEFEPDPEGYFQDLTSAVLGE